MKTTGVIRRIDELGRIVIPKEIRKSLRIKNGESLEVYLDGDSIILKKFSQIESLESISVDYVEAFNQIIKHNIIVTDIYAARETNTYNISSEDLVNAIIKQGKDAKYIPSLEACASYLKDNVKADDIVLTLGAGTVTNIGPMIVE